MIQHSALVRPALMLAALFASSSVLAMPFCGNKDSRYRYAPVYAYPSGMPGYTYAPVRPAHVPSWERVSQAMGAATPPPTPATAPAEAPAAR